MEHSKQPALEGGLHQIPTIRASILLPIIRMLESTELDADDLLAAHGLSRRQLQDPYGTVHLRRYVAFLEAAALHTGDPVFGMRLGTLLQPADLGPAGLLFAMVPTLRQALGYLGRYLGTLQSQTEVALHDHGTWASFTYRVADPSIWPRQQDSELTLSTMCSLIRSRLGCQWAPLEVHFEHGAGAPAAILRQVFRAPVRFMQATTQLLIPVAELDRRQAHRDAGVLPALERHAQDILDRQRGLDGDSRASLSRRVARAITMRLGTDRISVPIIAGDLGVSARSLQRGLSAEGTSLRQLLHEHRRSMAEARLLMGDGSIGQIAEAAGYADGTVLWRAFRNWTGSSPSGFRTNGASRR